MLLGNVCEYCRTSLSVAAAVAERSSAFTDSILKH